MNHEDDAGTYIGTPIDFDADNVWSKPKQQVKTFYESMLNELIQKESRKIERVAKNTVPVSGKLMCDDEFVGRVTSISFGDTEDHRLIAPNHKTIFCTHNSYNINRKTLIL